MLQRKLSAGVVLLAFVATALLVPSVQAAQNASAATAKNTAEKQAKLAERTAAYKAKQAVALSAAETTKLKGSCKAAQAKVVALGKKSTATYTARTKLFTSITTKVSSLQAGLKEAGLDTAELDTAQTAFAKAVTDYKAAHETLQTDLSDTSELDCVTDPEAFKAALLTARADRQAVADKAKLVVESIPAIRAALVNARKALVASTASPDTDNAEDSVNTTEGAQ